MGGKEAGTQAQCVCSPAGGANARSWRRLARGARCAPLPPLALTNQAAATSTIDCQARVHQGLSWTAGGRDAGVAYPGRRQKRRVIPARRR